MNGYTSKNFGLKWGTRQGCPLSPLLFAISIEPLAEILRADPRIQGVPAGGVTYKILLYADDVILYITDPLNSIPVLLSRLGEFGEISGYKINETKSEAMMLVGKWPTELDKEVTFNWSNTVFRYVGIVIITQITQLFNENYGRLITQIKSDLTRWEILPLSLLGRIETVRMNILPRTSFNRCLSGYQLPTSKCWIKWFLLLSD